MLEKKEIKENNDQENPKVILEKLQIVELQSRILYLNDPIDKDSAYKINRTLLALDELSNDPIKILINSPGGEINSGFFIFDCIKFVRSPVYTIGAGLVASAAALVYLAADKTRRISLPHARYMLHQPLSGMRGVVTDLEIHAREVDELKALINDIIAKATNSKVSSIEQDTDRDFWLNAKAAKNYGLVNTIIENKDDLKKLFPVPSIAPDTTTPSKDRKKPSGNTSKKTNATKK